MMHQQNLTLTCHPDGHFRLRNAAGELLDLVAAAEIAVDGQRRRITSDDGRPAFPGKGGPAMEAHFPDGLVLSLTEEPVADGLALTLTLANHGSAAVAVHRLFPLLGGDASDVRLAAPDPAIRRSWGVYKQGYQSWSYSGWRPLDGEDIAPRSWLTRTTHADPTWAPPRRGQFQSDGMLMLGCPDGGPALLLGFLNGARQLGRVELTAARQRRPWFSSFRPPPSGPDEYPAVRLAAFCELDGVLLRPGEGLESEPLMVAVGPERRLLESYAQTCGRRMRARVPRRVPAVWCSWYSHFSGVTEPDVLAAAQSLNGLSQTHPIDVVQIDDGYQTAVGDWLNVNQKFPSGLEALAQEIRHLGFMPGIWLAPFIAQRRSRLFREHPDWFVRRADGTPVVAGWNPAWRDIYHALDTTHPDVQEWLEALVDLFVAMGFCYLKLDFLYGAAIAGERYRLRTTRAGALREGLEIIRRAAGEEVFLLGCGSPMLQAVGLVDAMRVGPDVGPSWRYNFRGLPILGREPGMPCARNALRGALGRQWMHGHLWANDPDSLILRETQVDLNPGEARALASVAALSGGLLSLSDQTHRLSPQRLDWLRRCLPIPSRGLQPLSLLDGAPPFLSAGWHGEWLMLLAVNETDLPAPLSVTCLQLGLEPETVYHLYDVWEGEYLGVYQNRIPVATVPAREARVLALLRASDRPQLVGSTFHLSQAVGAAEAVWDPLEVQLAVAVNRPGQGSLTVAAPPSFRPLSVQVGRGALMARQEGAHRELHLHLDALPGCSVLISYDRERD